MTDDLTTSVTSGALVAKELQQLIDSSRKQFDLPPYVDPTEYKAWKQEKSDILTRQKTLHEQYITIDRTYTGRDRYLERLSTYSAPFISNTTPVGADQCAIHGWIDTKERHTIANAEVYRLTCQQCSAFLDVPSLTGVNSNLESVKRIYSLYPTFLNQNHADVCFWHSTSCHISVCAFPLVTTSDAFGLLETQGKLFQRWGTGLPVINTSFDKSKMRTLHRIVKAIEGIDIFSFPQQQLTTIHETAYLLPMFGWHCVDEHNYRLLKCTSCFRHVSVPNYLQLNDFPTQSIQSTQSTQSPSPPFLRSECTNGTFDPLGGHQSYCPWRNRDRARLNMKDSFFVAPKEPLNGCEWMLEIVCKEWFRLTTEDEKHPRHDEFRRNAERYMSTSIATNRWMMGDLTKYALSKSLKRPLLDISDMASTSSEKGKRQHLPDNGEEKIQGLQAKTTKDLAALTTMNEKDIERERNTSSDIGPHESSSLLQHDQYPKPSEDTPVDKSSTSQSKQQLDLLQPTTTAELDPQGLDTKSPEALEPPSELGIHSTMESETTDNEAETVRPDICVNNLGPGGAIEIDKDGETVTSIVSEGMTIVEKEAIIDKHKSGQDKVVDTEVTLIKTAGTDTASDGDKQANIPVDDETSGAKATLTQYDEDVSKQQTKDDYLLTPNDEDISTPTSWGLAHADNMTNTLDEDTNQTDQATMELVEDESENMDNGILETSFSNMQQPPDIIQNDNDDLISAGHDDDEGNMDSMNNELDLYDNEVTHPMEKQNERAEEPRYDTQQQSGESDIAAATDQKDPEAGLELEENHIDRNGITIDILETDETTPKITKQMDVDQKEYRQHTKDTMELELDDLDAGAFTNIEKPEMTTVNAELANVGDSDAQLDTIATPQDMIDDNISNNDDNRYASSSPPGDNIVSPHDMNDEGEALSEDIEDATATQDMDTSDSVLNGMESLDMPSQVTDEVNVATPQDTVDHDPTTPHEKVNEGIPDMQEYELANSITGDDQTAALDIRTLKMSPDHTESTVNEGEQSVDKNELAGVKASGYNQHRDLDDATDDIPLDQVTQTSAFETERNESEQNVDKNELVGVKDSGYNHHGDLVDATVDIPLDQVTQTAALETERNEIDQQEHSNGAQMAIGNNQDELQTSDEQVEEDIDDTGINKGSSTLLDATKVTTDENGGINADEATMDNYDEANREAYVDGSFNVQDQNDKPLLDGQVTEVSLEENSNLEKKGNDDDDTLLDENTESLIETDNDQGYLHQQGTAEDDNLTSQNTTVIDGQDLYANDQPVLVLQTPISPQHDADAQAPSTQVTTNNDQNAAIDDHSTIAPPIVAHGSHMNQSENSNYDDQLALEDTSDLLDTTLTGDNYKDDEPLIDQKI